MIWNDNAQDQGRIPENIIDDTHPEQLLFPAIFCAIDPRDKRTKCARHPTLSAFPRFVGLIDME